MKIERNTRGGLPEKPNLLSETTVFDWDELIALPDHLRKTALVLLKQGCVTAEDVAKVTHRARAVESLNLNVLVRMGKATKERKVRKVYFMPKGRV